MTITLPEVFSFWLKGEKIDDNTYIQILWVFSYKALIWGRISKIISFFSSLTIVLDIIGEENLKKYADNIKAFIQKINIARILIKLVTKDSKDIEKLKDLHFIYIFLILLVMYLTSNLINYIVTKYTSIKYLVLYISKVTGLGSNVIFQLYLLLSFILMLVASVLWISVNNELLITFDKKRYGYLIETNKKKYFLFYEQYKHIKILYKFIVIISAILLIFCSLITILSTIYFFYFIIEDVGKNFEFVIIPIIYLGIMLISIIFKYIIIFIAYILSLKYLRNIISLIALTLFIVSFTLDLLLS